jgi:hypothetical protein
MNAPHAPFIVHRFETGGPAFNIHHSLFIIFSRASVAKAKA